MSEDIPETKVENIQEHPAAQNLKDMLSSGQISQETYENLSLKFNKLHQAFTQSCSTEQILLRRTRDLNKELKSQKLTIQNSAAQQQEHRQSLSLLRQLVTNLQAELENTQQQTEATKANTEMKLKEAEKLEMKVATASQDQKTKLEPQKKAIIDENEKLERSIQEKNNTIEQLQQINQETLKKIQEADDKIAEYEKKRKAANQNMAEISSNPTKLKQKSNAAEAQHNTLLSEEKSVNERLKGLEQKFCELSIQVHDLETDYNHISNDIDGMINAFTDLRLRSSDLETKCDEQKQIKIYREDERKKILNQINEKNSEASKLNTKQDSIIKDIQRKEKESLKLEEAIARVMQDKKTLQNQLVIIKSDKETELETKKKYNEQLERTMIEKEKVLQQLAATENLNAELLEMIKAAIAEKNRKQMIHDTLSQKEIDFIQQLSEASLIRDRKAREMASMKKKTSDSRQVAKEKNLDYLDLVRKLELLTMKMNDTSILYEHVKLERNRHVNNVQTSRQLIVELKEKIRILESETEVLRKEFEITDAQVRVQSNELNQAFTRRDSTKSELKKAEHKYQELEEKIDFQSNETRRLNNVLQNIEDQIEMQQGRYARNSEDCAKKQGMLVDKVDNLCMLTEKLNRIEETTRNGEIELKYREEQISILNLQLTDFKRQIDLMKRKLPMIKAYNKEIEELKMQIDKESRDVDEVTKKLEVPSEQERKRSYCGKDFTLKELEDKVKTYEQRIHAKEQQLWEKKILLGEIQEKIKEKLSESEAYASKNQSMIAKSGQLRANALALERKKKAAVSERAVYLAMKGDLEQRKSDVKTEIEEAMRRSSRGEAFDETAEKLINMHKRDLAKTATMRNRQFEDDDDDEENQPRPGREHYDAYPTKDGLSRPYGAFPVFQPAKPSPNLRHYKNETDRPIVL